MKLKSLMQTVFALMAALALGLAAAAVDINTASESELTALPGIGPAKAKAIAAYRVEHGAFKTVDDLAKVSGIGTKTVERLKSQATVQPMPKKQNLPAVRQK